MERLFKSHNNKIFTNFGKQEKIFGETAEIIKKIREKAAKKIRILSRRKCAEYIDKSVEICRQLNVEDIVLLEEIEKRLLGEHAIVEDIIHIRAFMTFYSASPVFTLAGIMISMYGKRDRIDLSDDKKEKKLELINKLLYCLFAAFILDELPLSVKFKREDYFYKDALKPGSRNL